MCEVLYEGKFSGVEKEWCNEMKNGQKLNLVKRTQKGINKKQMQIMAEICQNRLAGRNRVFQRPSVAQIKKCWTKKVS